MWPPLYPLSLSTLYCKKCAKIPQQWWLAANLIQFVVLVQLLTWWWHMMCGGLWWPWSDPGASGNAETWVNCHNEQPDATFYNSIHGTVQCHHQNMNNTVSTAQWIPDDLPARGCLISRWILSRAIIMWASYPGSHDTRSNRDYPVARTASIGSQDQGEFPNW